ncbi:PREDICTED: uncharacterized protein LOC109589296 [Amphimedon queenslandica]|uniref:Uncharacterized protein n=1 Tax=Amphimedon queenslandica TaxID=400682 RepID=A0AAN0JVM9_AMPQE|nr:PREDICTED: uncharacterized protein LOC109589296 [Amphimedon queenslandica]|eukprot:XP_019860959.1 PREDICTED: uncharacterized protein LOC109589296 [Amphimedon queenslandica]
MMYNVLGVIKELKRPLDKLKEFLLCTYEGYDSKLKSKLDSCSDISSLFHVIRGECSLTNISLLEAVAKKFDFIEEVWEYIMEYKETLQKFCWLLLDICKVDDLRSIVVPSKPQPHLQCITFILNWEPEEHVLKDIKEILAKITEPYGRLIIIKIVCIESIPHD